MNLASRIRRARKLLGLSQAELSRSMKVHRSCVGHWEGLHNANPGPDRLAELAVVLGVSYEWLGTGRGPMKLGHDPVDDIPAAYGRLVNDADALRMLHAWENMPVRARNALLELAEQYAHLRKPKATNARTSVHLESGSFDIESGEPVAD
jgi:transcriptional regulator with XRE-family HTH domain